MDNPEYNNYVSWFEIPVLNLRRAVAFYNFIFGFEMEMVGTDAYSMAFFPVDDGVGGALVMRQGSIPSDVGILIYLNGGNDLNNVANKIEQAGGRLIMSKTLISEEAGYYAIFIDTEGNKLALHSNN